MQKVTLSAALQHEIAALTYRLAVPTARGAGVSQAIYYASNIKAAAAGTNTVTVTFSAATPYVDIRALEYSGLDPVNPLDSCIVLCPTPRPAARRRSDHLDRVGRLA